VTILKVQRPQGSQFGQIYQVLACAPDTVACNTEQVDELGKLFENFIEDQVVILITVRNDFEGAVIRPYMQSSDGRCNQ
jgi:hypothetical protein